MIMSQDKDEESTAMDALIKPTVSNDSNITEDFSSDDADIETESIRFIFSWLYWKRVGHRAKYELLLLTAALPQLLPKLFFLYWCSMYVFRNLAYARHVPGPPLKDLGFELIPYIDNDFWSEWLLWINHLSSLALVLVPWLTASPHKRGVFGVDLYIKAMNCAVVGHFLRFLTYISTSLPGPAEHCRKNAPLYRDTFTLYEILTRRSKVHIDPNCGDLIFSGHVFQTASFTVVCLLHMHAFIPNKTLARLHSAVLVLSAAIQPYFILGARNHYSVDVVVAAYTAPMVCLTMEHFYKTTFYTDGLKWYARKLVPQGLASFLTRNNPSARYDKKKNSSAAYKPWNTHLN